MKDQFETNYVQDPSKDIEEEEEEEEEKEEEDED